MAIVKYSIPQNGIFGLLDKLFDEDLFVSPKINTVPNHDIIENKNEYVVDFALAGFKKEDISLNIDENNLTISGERKSNDDTNYNRKNTFYGKFEKSFTLPENINIEKINATFNDGILSITIPKDEKAKLSKVIEIM